MPSTVEPQADAAGRPGRTEACDDLTQFVYADPAKALVMSCISELVGCGQAEWSLRDDGNVELRFLTGEIFLLGDRTVTRTA
jgi:hypothetical protein